MSVFTNPADGSPEQGAEYIAAVLGLLGDADPMDVLRRTPDALRRACARLTEAELSRREAPGKWSIRHVLRHLVDSEIVWAWRLRLALAQDRPTLTGFDQDAWADRLGYDEADAATSRTEFAILRSSNLGLLERVSSADLQRVALHEERGEESVAHMARLYAGHDLLHLRQIDRIRRTLGGEAGA